MFEKFANLSHFEKLVAIFFVAVISGTGYATGTGIIDNSNLFKRRDSQ